MLIRVSLLIALLGITTSAQSAKSVRTKAANPDKVAATGDRAIVKGFFHEYALDHVASGPAIVAIDDDDNVWIALAKTGKLARFANQTMRLFDIGADSRPVGLAVGTKANGHPGLIWIAASYDNKLISFDPQSGQKREFKIDGDDSWPFNVNIAPDGFIWFTERASGRVGRLDPKTSEVKHYDLPTPKGGPAGLAIDPKSGRVWFTESYADGIASLDPATGHIKEYKMGDVSTGLVTGPAGLALDQQGGVWFAKLEGKLGYLAPGSEEIKIINLPSEVKRPAGIVIAGNGNVWAVALDGNLLMCYEPSTERFSLYPLPVGEADERPNTPPFARTSRPFGIATDRQGNVWFSQQYTGQLGVLDIAAPVLAVLSPGPVVRTASVPLTVRALDRVSGVKNISISLDGKPITIEQGRLDMRSVVPGKHKLEVSAQDLAGYKTATAVEFDYAPSQIALIEALQGLEPANKSGEAAKEAMLNITKDLSKGDVRAKLSQIQTTLVAGTKHFRPFPNKAYAALIDFQMQNAGQIIEIKILDKAPYFSSGEISVRKGDTVRFKYDPPSDGHSISHNLHRVEIQDLQVRSNLMRAGESFSYRFDKPGQFTVKDGQVDGSNLIVKVN